MPIEPTIERIKSIAAITEPVLRNLHITQSYCELSTVFEDRMKSGANWCTFATWASKQAGQTIRHEDLKDTLENWLKNESRIQAAVLPVATNAKRAGAQQSLDQIHSSILGSLVTAAANRAADAVSRGNKKVFEEIAYEFSRFMSSCFSDISFDHEHIEAFCKTFTPGPPPAGQDYLQKAFGWYYKALFETDPGKKIQLNLLANLLIGFHEQNRLQPEIFEALNVSAIDFQHVKSDLLSKFFSGAGFCVKLRLFFKRVFGKSLLDDAMNSLIEQIQSHLRIFLTAHLMTLTLPPANCLHLNKDLTADYPASLKELTNPDLLELLAEVDPTPNSPFESGATDWTDLAERMHYIAELFRCFHESRDLFSNAFTVEQVLAIKDGRLPGGDL